MSVIPITLKFKQHKYLRRLSLIYILYLSSQFRSLFVATCETSVVEAMWDVYLLEEDPFLVFFLALVMIINARLNVVLLFFLV